MLATDLHLVSRLRMSGSVILLPIYTLMTWTENHCLTPNNDCKKTLISNIKVLENMSPFECLSSAECQKKKRSSECVCVCLEVGNFSRHDELSVSQQTQT